MDIRFTDMEGAKQAISSQSLRQSLTGLPYSSVYDASFAKWPVAKSRVLAASLCLQQISKTRLVSLCITRGAQQEVGTGCQACRGCHRPLSRDALPCSYVHWNALLCTEINKRSGRTDARSWAKP